MKLHSYKARRSTNILHHNDVNALSASRYLEYKISTHHVHARSLSSTGAVRGHYIATERAMGSDETHLRMIHVVYDQGGAASVAVGGSGWVWGKQYAP